ncbi:helix-turn-helix domain-containing protein [Nonomuraea sp. SYSU D8015]|uniref:helix-turn-helix domain-containing protein n=1 Tax=Nonomuraea sp. SYSU D8015 TaxID=2593644 RepID=UPI001CB759AB|nr:helix-turn-helix transcriptional regulator [Nonomuraea sp. SYSU D8015]
MTERERQIARLAAGGMTDQQIADELHLTTRTVSNHLYRVYFKLGAKGRHDLRFLLDEPG